MSEKTAMRVKDMPIFADKQFGGIEQIAEDLRISEEYVLDIKMERRPLTDLFMRKAVRAYKKPITDIFGPAEESSDA